jgi:vancomycin permeability regulator SanA
LKTTTELKLGVKRHSQLEGVYFYAVGSCRGAFMRMRHIFKWQWWLRLAIVLTILTIGCSELADWFACNMATNSAPGTSCGVLVLGYPSHSDGTASPIQEMRVAIGVRAFHHSKCDRLVFSGAAVKNQIVEAQTMAQLARSMGVSPAAIVLETHAQNTWENIKFSIPVVEKYHRILIASDSLHAQRGRRYLCKQRPSLCERTFVGVTYQPFERWWWKIAAGCHELFAWGRDLILFP